MKLPPLISLRPYDKIWARILSDFLRQIPHNETYFGQLVMDPRRLDWQNRFREYLELAFRKVWPSAQLHLFGSSCNGFGFQSSDLDICMTFAGQKSPPNETESKRIIKQIARILHGMNGRFQGIYTIMNAKVPIVKFFHTESQLEGDISLYNTLVNYITNLNYTIYVN